MPRYSFVARSRKGKQERGSIEAPNPDEAISLLQARDLIVVSVNEQKSREKVGLVGLAKRRFHAGVKAADLVVFGRALAAMTQAGMPLLKSMEIVCEQTRSKRLYDTVQKMIRDIRGGSTLRDAVAKHPAVFSPFWVGLIETGEASGQLTQALEQITLHMEKSGSLRRKVVSALMYPLVLVIVAAAAVLVFSIKIIPTFADLFNSFGAKLPALTLFVIALSGFIRKYLLLVILACVAGWFLFQAYTRTKMGRLQFDKFKLQMPVLGPVFQCVIAQEFASNLSTLLKAGVPILHAMEIVITTCSNSVVAEILQHVRLAVREGRPLAEPLGQTDVFPMMVPQMVAVGEQTGKLPTMLEELAKYYEEQASTAIERMTTLLEPIMLIFMGGIIGTLVLAMYLPVFQITSLGAK